MLGLKCRDWSPSPTARVLTAFSWGHHQARLLLLPLLVASSPLAGHAQTPPTMDAGTGGGDAGTGAVVAAPPKPWVCPLEQQVTVLPKVLKKQLGAATRFAEVKKLLEPLLLETRWDMYSSCKEDDPVSVVLDVFRARIVSAETEDVVLQARGKMCGQEQFITGAVLHPLAEKNAYCSINMPFLPGKPEQSTSYDPTKIVFAFENLTDPVRKNIRVELVDCPRFCHSELSYWEAQDGSLVKIFGIEWGSGGDYSGSSSSSVSVTAEGKEFPRKLRLKESFESCGSMVTLPSGEIAHSSACDEASSEAIYCYQRNGSQLTGTFNECGRRNSTYD
ncbi:hypothetical protein FJV41_34160 [Myxococcus llanfairpwllgwyngyllgogerychwyrndrobwllllantysiliogogogochensis]|uniref:Uncharacterized protein n=1 Tax=Myxococcus llanfairpwllgwyngyllgogerychwyrndrobwllllantysiliogogogochensis TaxID=2590453 RepID=A0A540WR08_9BACT|nr:hypothetical protein [Myxococcus llanfairpwllgwyngyllgogerychwyrndrobwllllantysiliogogogochensis]TQF11438.1 hypothetical protein FJV41_34160 [Myxococcus llanfairpwllgwyngyllgogerychwyrndrobwllllantysiliogogogochensis]